MHTHQLCKRKILSYKTYKTRYTRTRRVINNMHDQIWMSCQKWHMRLIYSNLKLYLDECISSGFDINFDISADIGCGRMSNNLAFHKVCCLSIRTEWHCLRIFGYLPKTIALCKAPIESASKEHQKHDTLLFRVISMLEPDARIRMSYSFGIKLYAVPEHFGYRLLRSVGVKANKAFYRDRNYPLIVDTKKHRIECVLSICAANDDAALQLKNTTKRTYLPVLVFDTEESYLHKNSLCHSWVNNAQKSDTFAPRCLIKRE